ncbi:MAG TPA: hypothetical protein VIM41_11310 [Gammaproteobacteria bacterium]
MLRNRSLLQLPVLLFLLITVAHAQASTIGERIKQASFSKVAVVVYPQNEPARKMVRTAQSRIENVLLDNGITVLDQDKANELKNVWKNLEDPGYFVTADDFVDNAEKYKLDGLIRVYLNAESSKGFANFFTATAQADVRFVAQDAAVEAHTTTPMGVPGNPPSDGLTEVAAMVNAVQRAIDKAASTVGLQVVSFTAPGAFSFDLVPSQEQVPLQYASKAATDADFVKFANLSTYRWKAEEVTCAVAAGSGDLAAVAGYIKETQSGFNRVYGSIVHVVNIKEGREITTFEAEAIAQRKKHEKARAKVLDCVFLSSWRYLAVVSGNYLILWDIERGLLLSKVPIEGGLEQAQLAYAKHNDKDYLGVKSEKGASLVFEIVRKTT